MIKIQILRNVKIFFCWINNIGHRIRALINRLDISRFDFDEDYKTIEFDNQFLATSFYVLFF